MWPLWFRIGALGAMLLVSAAQAADSRTPSKTEQPETATVLHLGTSPGSFLWTGDETASPSLVRELARQSLLIAARDELGLLTRDAWLGSEMPTSGNNAPLDVVYSNRGPTNLEVLRGFVPVQEVIHQQPFSVPSERLVTSYPGFIATFEAASRTSFVDVLKRAGFVAAPTGAKPAVGKGATVEAVERLLEDLTIFSQFSALRTVHGELRGQGESSTLLEQLVRGYAHLGVLTELHWHPAHKVFKARSLLYAQRMVQKDPRSVAALDHLAYAEALCGLHSAALQTLDVANKLASDATAAAVTGANGDPKPAAASRAIWVPLIAAYCGLDTTALEKLQADASLGFLAPLLRFFALEQAGCPTLAVTQGAQVIQAVPDCFRVHSGLCRFGKVGLGHWVTAIGPQTLAQHFRENLTAMPDLPPAVAKLLKKKNQSIVGRLLGGNADEDAMDFKQQAKVIQSLVELGQVPRDSAAAAEANVDDGIELRWETLGVLLRELAWNQIWQRANFETNMLGVASDEWLEATQPIAMLHPYRAFMANHAHDNRRKLAAQKEMLTTNPEGLEIQAEQLVASLAYFTNQGRESQDATRNFNHLTWKNSDETAFEIVQRMYWRNDDATRERLCRQLLAASPHAPLAQAALIEHSFDKVRSDAKEWEKSADRHPLVALAFGRHYLAVGDLANAEKLFAMAAKISHEMETYLELAAVYEKQGQKARWLTTLEEYLKQPAFGLEHAQVNQRISIHFTGKKAWAEAKPYAEAAAESYSAWGLAEAARVNEALRDWPQAEKYFSAQAQRYRGSNFEWYFFCKRTGEGDLEQARKVGLDYIQDVKRQKLPLEGEPFGSFFLLEKEHDKALQSFETGSRSGKSYEQMHVALLADELQQPERRDKALQAIAGKSRDLKAVNARNGSLIALAEAMLADLAKQGKAEFDIPTVVKLCTEADPVGRCNFHYFLGRYLDRRGKTEAAIEQWKQSMRFQTILAFSRTHAGDSLIRHDVLPGEYDGVLQQGDAVEGDAAKNGAK